MEKHHHETYTVDIDPSFEPDETVDVLRWTPPSYLTNADILWASPPCQAFSVAAIGKNWNMDRTPKSDRAKKAIELVERTCDIIDQISPKWWFIENPRGMLRKLGIIERRFPEAIRHTVTYCQYGDTRMKPTDIWTNAHWWHPRPACKNGNPCHEAAPRGAKTGTQGINGARDRGRIPSQLFEEILKQS